MTAEEFPAYLDVDYTGGEGETAADYPSLTEKFAMATDMVETALEQYRNPAVMWTGGKDSTLALYVVREVAAEHGFDVPPVVFIDHYQQFDSVEAFVQRWVGRWKLDLVVARNQDFADRDAEPGEELPVDQLSDRNQRELDRLDFEGDTFHFTSDSLEGNHLLKTVALNDAIDANAFDGILSGVRWDEQAARADETFFSPRHDSTKYPPHDRIQPVLQFDERAVWDATWGFVVPDTVEDFPAGYVPQHIDDLPDGVEPEDIPVSPKYFEGFRSLGTQEGSAKRSDDPAWL